MTIEFQILDRGCQASIAVYLFVVGAFRIFVPEFHKRFSAALSVVNYALKRQMDIHYPVYTVGFIILAVLGLSCMIRWSGRQNDASKRARLLTSFFSYSTHGQPSADEKLDPNYSNIAFTVSMCTVAISLMRDKSWKIENLMDIMQKSEAAPRTEKVKVDELLLNILPRDIAEGIPFANFTHPIDIVLTALEMQWRTKRMVGTCVWEFIPDR